MKFTVSSLNVGKIQKLSSGKTEVESGFAKISVNQALLTKTGFADDEQADLKHHGGADKAICVFSSHHFPGYEEFLGIKMAVPAFGENFTVDRADEKELFIGDIFVCGEVTVQISQPRQPCSKTGLFHKNNKVIKFMAETGRTGFYLRVLNEGTVSRHDVFERTESDGRISLTAANEIMYRRDRSESALKELIDHPLLSMAWKTELSARLS